MTTAAQIKAWFDSGKEQGATHMLVVCDTFDHDDYPVYVKQGQNPADIRGKTCLPNNMQRLMECYALHKTWESYVASGVRRVNDFSEAPEGYYKDTGN